VRREGRCGLGGRALAGAAKAALAGADGKVTLGIRPEFVDIAEDTGSDTVPATVTSVRNMGTHFLAEFRVGDQRVAAKLRAIDAVAGSTVRLRFPQQRTLYYVNDHRVA